MNLKDELGEYNPKRDLHGYASEFEFMPNQSIELEKSAEAKHLKLKFVCLLGFNEPLYKNYTVTFNTEA